MKVFILFSILLNIIILYHIELFFKCNDIIIIIKIYNSNLLLAYLFSLLFH